MKPGAAHYCANCRHWSTLIDGAYCAWCLEYFYANRRMPTAPTSRKANDRE
jgi:hypothetical protein